MKLINKFTSLAALSAAFLTSGQLHAQTAVDLELILIADVSGSVDASEYALQKTGYVNAFQDATIQSAILGGALGKIAVTYIEWSGASQQFVNVGWSLIDSVASSNAFAAAINSSVRAFSGSTAPGSAINFATPLFASNSFTAGRQVIDVSGDGAENDGANTLTARNNALAAGVDTINGITIGGDASLQAFYQNNIVGGVNGFHLHATSFQDFETGINRKLFREITNTAVPEPSTYGMIGAAALMGVVIVRRRKTKNNA